MSPRKIFSNQKCFRAKIKTRALQIKHDLRTKMFIVALKPFGETSKTFKCVHSTSLSTTQECLRPPLLDNQASKNLKVVSRRPFLLDNRLLRILKSLSHSLQTFSLRLKRARCWNKMQMQLLSNLIHMKPTHFFKEIVSALTKRHKHNLKGKEEMDPQISTGRNQTGMVIPLQTQKEKE